jgi:hypothetical protein
MASQKKMQSEYMTVVGRHPGSDGKGMAGQQSLWRFNVSAGGEPKRATPPFQGSDDITNKTLIQIMGQPLGADGNLWITLPDGVDLVAPVRVPSEDFDVSGIGAEKFHPYTMASSSTTSANLETNTPKFCVGQTVTFELRGLPPDYADAVGHWDLLGKFVNDYEYADDDDASGNYFVNLDLLAITDQNLTTVCWFVNKPGGRVGVNANLRFSNGQCASVAPQVNISIYRPTISNFYPYPPFYAALVPTNSSNELQLGDNSGHGAMRYDLKVNSIVPFSGGVNVVQLISASRALANTTYGGGQQSTTYGQFCLDNSYPYFSSDLPVFAPLYYNNTPFLDQPGYGLNYIFGLYPANLCAINDFFKDYIVFKPNGGIYVTLGRVFWSWSASTSKINGVWSNPTYQVNGPSSPDDSDEFPTWPDTYYNAGVNTGD